MSKSADKAPKLARSFASAFSLDSSTSHLGHEKEEKLETKQTENLNQVESASNTRQELSSLLQSMPQNTSHYEGYENICDKYDVLPILSLPDIALENILSFLTHDQVAQMRVICKR